MESCERIVKFIGLQGKFALFRTGQASLRVNSEKAGSKSEVAKAGSAENHPLRSGDPAIPTTVSNQSPGWISFKREFEPFPKTKRFALLDKTQ
jgi:hypothetical protein